MEDTTKNKKEKNYEKLVTNIQMYSTVLEQLKQQMVVVDNELKSLLEIYDDFLYRLIAIERLEMGKGFVKIVNGIYSSGSVNENKKFLLSVGYRIFLIKDKDYVKDYIQKQIKKIEDKLNKKKQEYNNLVNTFMMYNEQLEKLMKEYRQIEKHLQ